MLALVEEIVSSSATATFAEVLEETANVEVAAAEARVHWRKGERDKNDVTR